MSCKSPKKSKEGIKTSDKTKKRQQGLFVFNKRGRAHRAAREGKNGPSSSATKEYWGQGATPQLKNALGTYPMR